MNSISPFNKMSGLKINIDEAKATSIDVMTGCPVEIRQVISSTGTKETLRYKE